MANLIFFAFQISLVILFNVLIFCSSNQTFGYIKTKVIQESFNCKSSFISTLNSVYCESVWDCAMICSSNPQCRRFMFDYISKRCFFHKFGKNCITSGTTSEKECYIQKSVCASNSCSKCAIGYYGNHCQYVAKDCLHIRNTKIVDSTISFIRPKEDGPVLEVRCHLKGRTYIHFREKSCNEVDFNRTWDEYAHGFGNVYSEYWLGLENIYHLAKDSNNKLRIQYVIGNKKSHVVYRKFRMATSSDDYPIFMLHRSNALSNDQNDILLHPNYSIYGIPFSTYDRDNTSFDCPVRFGGGWWYIDDPKCSRTNLNGKRSAENFEARMNWLNDGGYDYQLTSLSISIVTSN